MAKRSEHAKNMWIPLTAQAKKRQPVTYGSLAEAMGVGAPLPWYLGPILDYILQYCKAKNIPRLDLIVVSKETGVPSEWLGKDKVDLAREQEKVYSYNWNSIAPPTAAELEAVFRK